MAKKTTAGRKRVGKRNIFDPLTLASAIGTSRSLGKYLPSQSRMQSKVDRFVRGNPVKVFGTEHEAEQFAEKFRKQGIPATVKFVERKAGNVWVERWQVTYGEKAQSFYDSHLSNPAEDISLLNDLTPVPSRGHIEFTPDGLERYMRDGYIYAAYSATPVMQDGYRVGTVEGVVHDVSRRSPGVNAYAVCTAAGTRNPYQTYVVKALNLNDVEVTLKIQASSPEHAKRIVAAKNKYLRIQSVSLANPRSSDINAAEDIVTRRTFRHYAIRLIQPGNRTPVIGEHLPNSWHPAGTVDGFEEDTELDGTAGFEVQSAEDIKPAIRLARSYWPDADTFALIGSDNLGEMYLPESGAILLDSPRVLYIVKTDNGNPKLRRRNPASESDALYESFHGAPPGETLEIHETEHVHGHLASLGDLTEVVVKLSGGTKVGATTTLTAPDPETASDKDIVHVASNELGNQLYLVGGDQSVDVKKLGFRDSFDIKHDGETFEATELKDLMVLGEIQKLTYRTQKSFDDFAQVDYFHQLGEDTKVRPMLLYDTMNDRMKIAGGEYHVHSVGVVN
jgi:hypothetical protein